jgi:hypothetical protein
VRRRLRERGRSYIHGIDAAEDGCKISKGQRNPQNGIRVVRSPQGQAVMAGRRAVQWQPFPVPRYPTQRTEYTEYLYIRIILGFISVIKHIHMDTKKVSTMSKASVLTLQRPNKCLGETDHII